VSLNDRVRKLEARAERQDTLTWAEYHQASERERVRVLKSAYSKLGDDVPGRLLSDEHRALLDGDTPEQQAQDRNVIERYHAAHGAPDLRAASEEARQKLRAVGVPKVPGDL